MPSRVVVGIDVGGVSKGFHCVALRGREIEDQAVVTDPKAALAWCRKLKASVVGVDAPCRWSKSGRARSAERELMRKKIYCFSTPRAETAKGHPKKYYEWMLQGAALYAELGKSYRLIAPRVTGESIVFETFPHAVVCALEGKVVPAKPKSAVRRRALQRAGVSSEELPNIDFVDAALCAVTANAVLSGRYHLYGEQEEGFIVVPKERMT